MRSRTWDAQWPRLWMTWLGCPPYWSMRSQRPLPSAVVGHPTLILTSRQSLLAGEGWQAPHRRSLPAGTALPRPRSPPGHRLLRLGSWAHMPRAARRAAPLESGAFEAPQPTRRPGPPPTDASGPRTLRPPRATCPQTASGYMPSGRLGLHALRPPRADACSSELSSGLRNALARCSRGMQSSVCAGQPRLSLRTFRSPPNGWHPAAKPSCLRTYTLTYLHCLRAYVRTCLPGAPLCRQASWRRGRRAGQHKCLAVHTVAAPATRHAPPPRQPRAAATPARLQGPVARGDPREIQGRSKGL